MTDGVCLSTKRSPVAEMVQRILPRPMGIGFSRPRVRALVNNASTNASGMSSEDATSPACRPGLNPDLVSRTCRRNRASP